jgi:predicted RNA polymerase sigma factor
MDTERGDLKELFQQEFAKMVAVISKVFGLQHIEVAEDVVSETFLLATETWGAKGIPANPTAWLYAVAKQKTLYHFRRTRIFENVILPEWRNNQDQEITEADFSAENVKDNQLQMLFAICTPVIASEAQIGLALRILCGFGIDEIADAFLTNKETINKRLYRARERIRVEKVIMELPQPEEISHRLINVLRIIYLLFSEGYYSKTQNQILRKEFCIEALRLGLMLCEYEPTNLPETNALVALMCFHASRFNARHTQVIAHILYEQQNRALWDEGLIRQGMHYLEISMKGNEITTYHLEARIACLHCDKTDGKEKWEEILQLYDKLLQIHYSESGALNRIYSLFKINGSRLALVEAEKLQLNDNHFYYTLLGELYQDLDKVKASKYFRNAYVLAKTRSEKRVIRDKLNHLKAQQSHESLS